MIASPFYSLPVFVFILHHLQHCSYCLFVLISWMALVSSVRVSSFFPLSPAAPLLSYSLPSINFFLLPHLLSFPIQYFPLLSSGRHTHLCLHTHHHPHICSLRLSVSGVGSILPSPAGRVSLLHIRLSVWGHNDLLQPVSGINIGGISSCSTFYLF